MKEIPRKSTSLGLIDINASGEVSSTGDSPGEFCVFMQISIYYYILPHLVRRKTTIVITEVSQALQTNKRAFLSTT